MAVKSVNLSSTYVVATGPMKLNVVVGDAQLGSTLVELDGQRLGKGEINDLVIGNGPDLVGKELTTKSIVTDINEMTNRTSITYELSGGQKNEAVHQECVVGAEGESVVYRATFTLTG